MALAAGSLAAARQLIEAGASRDQGFKELTALATAAAAAAGGAASSEGAAAAAAAAVQEMAEVLLAGGPPGGDALTAAATAAVKLAHPKSADPEYRSRADPWPSCRWLLDYMCAAGGPLAAPASQDAAWSALHELLHKGASAEADILRLLALPSLAGLSGRDLRLLCQSLCEAGHVEAALPALLALPALPAELQQAAAAEEHEGTQPLGCYFSSGTAKFSQVVADAAASLHPQALDAVLAAAGGSGSVRLHAVHFILDGHSYSQLVGRGKRPAALRLLLSRGVPAVPAEASLKHAPQQSCTSCPIYRLLELTERENALVSEPAVQAAIERCRQAGLAQLLLRWQQLDRCLAELAAALLAVLASHSPCSSPPVSCLHPTCLPCHQPSPPSSLLSRLALGGCVHPSLQLRKYKGAQEGAF